MDHWPRGITCQFISMRWGQLVAAQVPFQEQPDAPVPSSQHNAVQLEYVWWGQDWQMDLLKNGPGLLDHGQTPWYTCNPPRCDVSRWCSCEGPTHVVTRRLPNCAGTQSPLGGAFVGALRSFGQLVWCQFRLPVLLSDVYLTAVASYRYLHSQVGAFFFRYTYTYHSLLSVFDYNEVCHDANAFMIRFLVMQICEALRVSRILRWWGSWGCFRPLSGIVQQLATSGFTFWSFTF